MTRAFSDEPLDAKVFAQCVELACRAPSAGKSQGWNLIVWMGEETANYWDIALPHDRRATFAFPDLLRAPAIALVLADRDAYLSRYSEPDKEHTGLGVSSQSWPAPYWTIDASFATMILMLALEDAGLGVLFFAHAQEDQLRSRFGIPDAAEVLGVLAVGHRSRTESRPGRSASRHRRAVDDVIHHGGW